MDPSPQQKTKPTGIRALRICKYNIIHFGRVVVDCLHPFCPSKFAISGAILSNKINDARVGKMLLHGPELEQRPSVKELMICSTSSKCVACILKRLNGV